MKKTIFATLVLVVSAFATATAGGKGDSDLSSSKLITVNPTFSKLVVDGNVDVVLFEDNITNEIRTFGNTSDMAATSITEKDGVLTIKNKKNNGQKVLVYVPVKKLSVIEASGDSKVSSATPLQSSTILLIAKGDCKFNIRSVGAIEVEKDGDVELSVEENSIPYMVTTRS